MTFIPMTEIGHTASSTRHSSRHRTLPPWFHVQLRMGPHYKHMRQVIDTHQLHTICEEARCPNIWECWNNRTATFLILGDVCTRRCHYCSVTTGRPLTLDSQEPLRVAQSVKLLNLQHAVITSVNRDDLADGGATIFRETIQHVRSLNPHCTVEVLIPDFQGHSPSLEQVITAGPHIVNHNIETVPRLFPSLRPQGKYSRSLQVLQQAKDLGGRTKSGLMVGLGETTDEIWLVMQNLRAVGCDILTIGQYLRPTVNHAPVSRYYTPIEFNSLKKEGMAMGFQHVESGPLVRSSYHAEKQANQMLGDGTANPGDPSPQNSRCTGLGPN